MESTEKLPLIDDRNEFQPSEMFYKHQIQTNQFNQHPSLQRPRPFRKYVFLWYIEGQTNVNEAVVQSLNLL